MELLGAELEWGGGGAIAIDVMTSMVSRAGVNTTFPYR